MTPLKVPPQGGYTHYIKKSKKVMYVMYPQFTPINTDFKTLHKKWQKLKKGNVASEKRKKGCFVNTFVLFCI